MVCVQSHVCCDVSVQTDARASCNEQYTQVNVNQSTEWTQCTVDHTDQSVQVTYKLLSVAVQADAPTVQVSLAATEDKLNAETEMTSHDQSKEGPCVDMSKMITHNHAEEGSGTDVSVKETEDADSLSAVEQVSEIVEVSLRHKDISGPALSHEQQQQLYDGNTQAATRDNPDVSVHHPLTALIEQSPEQHNMDTVTHIPVVAPTSVSGTCPAAVLHPSFTQWRPVADTKRVYSFEQRTQLARSLTLHKSSVHLQQLVPEMPLLPSTQALVTQHGSEMPAVHTSSYAEPCVERSHSCAAVTDTPAVINPSASSCTLQRAKTQTSVQQVVTLSDLPLLTSFSADVTRSVSTESAAKLNQSAARVQDCTSLVTTVNDADVATLDSQFTGYKQNEQLMSCEHTAASMCGDQPWTEQTEACTDSQAQSGYGDNGAPKATVMTEADSSVAELNDCSVRRGRRRPLFVHRGPLMDTVDTVGSSHQTLQKESDSSASKLPVMLLGTIVIAASYLVLSVTF